MNTRMLMKLVCNAGVVYCAATSAACTAVIGSELNEMGDDQPGEDITDEVQQEIGEPSCADLLPSKTYVGFVPPPGYISPLPGILTQAGCFGAHAVQINNYSPLYLGIGDYGGMHVQWAGDHLDTQAACESAFIRADIYRKIAGEWALVGSKQDYGTWEGFFGGFRCLLPGTAFQNAVDNPDILVANASYKIVATARIGASFNITPRFKAFSLLDGYI